MACTSTDSSVTRLAGPSSLAQQPGIASCAGVLGSTLSGPLVVAAGDRCEVREVVKGNVTVEGTLTLTDGGRIEGNLDVREGATVTARDARIKGNIESRALVTLEGTRIEGNIIQRGGTLSFTGSRTTITGNLDVLSPTILSGAGDATFDGNIQCRGRVTDRHTGRLTVGGGKEGCPPSL